MEQLVTKGRAQNQEQKWGVDIKSIPSMNGGEMGGLELCRDLEKEHPFLYWDGTLELQVEERVERTG
jgi:hypothetical protein